MRYIKNLKYHGTKSSVQHVLDIVLDVRVRIIALILDRIFLQRI